ncbi:hypothetical protein GCM10009799_32770 [Nocardiopsis rhodophaea]|uniref:Flp family type IVb pilin n=1 Tax=Nocardiopsis rhodophaea TaxID=280238 RepID=A0ABP5ER09_9ACTN
MFIAFSDRLKAFRQRRNLKKSDKGAGFIEYGAILLLIAAIAGAVWALDVKGTVSGWIDDSLTEIGEGPDGGGDPEPSASPQN